MWVKAVSLFCELHQKRNQIHVVMSASEGMRSELVDRMRERGIGDWAGRVKWHERTDDDGNSRSSMRHAMQ